MRDLVTWWSSSDWRREAEAWILDRLACAGRTVTGPIEQPRIRVWSTQLTVPTDVGRLWFKENSAPGAFEAALVARIHARSPGRVLPPLAVEASRGWLLSPDGGPTLAEHARTQGRPVHPAEWELLLTQYAALQLDLATDPDVPAATGLPVLDPADAPTVAADAVRRAVLLPEAHLLRIDDPTARALLAGVPLMAAAAATVADLGLPNTLEHNDLHPNNAFVPGTGPLRFFDLGDAFWGHPLCSVLVPERVMAQEWRCAIDDPRVTGVVDAYLGVWADAYDVPMARLRAALPAVRRVAALHRYLSWERVLAAVPPACAGPDLDYGARWLRHALT